MTRTYTEKRFFQWYEDETSVTLRGRSGSYGGGSEALVVTITMNSYQVVTQGDEPISGILASDSHRGGCSRCRISRQRGR
jgi:hypothetical protein